MSTLSTLSHSTAARPTRWVGAVLFALMFWFSSSLLMDFVIMPGLFVGGMMSQPDFGPAGYAMFWVFNRIELLCVGVILTGLLVARHTQARREQDVIASGLRSRWATEIAIALLAITLVLTYAIAPAMAALGASLDPFATAAVPAAMDEMHGLYFGLEALKLVGCGALLSLFYRDFSSVKDA